VINIEKGTDVTDFRRVYRTPKTDEELEREFPQELTISLARESFKLRYGENPNQPAAVYRFKGISLAEFTDIRLAKSGKGGISATNLMDITRALEILKYFTRPSVAVMKHLIPSGFATQNNEESLDELYRRARNTDARSAYGSVVVFNKPVDIATAAELTTTFVEAIAAPDFEEGAMGILERKEDLRTILYSNLDKLPKFIGDDSEGLYDLKVLSTGRVIVQRPYLTSIKSVEDLVLDPLVRNKDGRAAVVERDPKPQELNDMLTAWYINFGVRSNGIVFVKNGVTVAVSSGQQERVGAVEQAIVKSYQKAMDRQGINYDPIEGAKKRLLLSSRPLENAVMSSDGFFPFRDSIDLAAGHGVTAVIQPGGSIRDYEVIEAVNRSKMAMAFTLERCFGHF